MTTKTKKQVLDFVDRTSATFIETFIAVAMVTGLSGWSELKAAGTAGCIAAGKFAYAKVHLYLHPTGD